MSRPLGSFLDGVYFSQVVHINLITSEVTRVLGVIHTSGYSFQLE